MRDFITIHSFEFEQVQEHEQIDDRQDRGQHHSYHDEDPSGKAAVLEPEVEECECEGADDSGTGEGEFDFHFFLLLSFRSKCRYHHAASIRADALPPADSLSRASSISRHSGLYLIPFVFGDDCQNQVFADDAGAIVELQHAFGVGPGQHPLSGFGFNGNQCLEPFLADYPSSADSEDIEHFRRAQIPRVLSPRRKMKPDGRSLYDDRFNEESVAE
jgi:hypothetical protein